MGAYQRRPEGQRQTMLDEMLWMGAHQSADQITPMDVEAYVGVKARKAEEAARKQARREAFQEVREAMAKDYPNLLKVRKPWKELVPRLVTLHCAVHDYLVAEILHSQTPMQRHEAWSDMVQAHDQVTYRWPRTDE